LFERRVHIANLVRVFQQCKAAGLLVQHPNQGQQQEHADGIARLVERVAMEAGVMDTLWSLEDMVRMVDEWEARERIA
jgi:hypothetical protein